MSSGLRNSGFKQKNRRLRRWRTGDSENHLLSVRIQASFIQERGGQGMEVWLVVANFLVQNSFVLITVHIGHDVPVNLQQEKPSSVLQLFNLKM